MDEATQGAPSPTADRETASADGSLLAHLAERFPRRTEDLATEALGHILRSAECRAALDALLRGAGAEVGPIKSVRTLALALAAKFGLDQCLGSRGAGSGGRRW